MSENLNLTRYTSAHRVRERAEDGYVDVTGKRQKKWRGWYHVYADKPDGSTTRIKRQRIIGPCSEMTKTEARDEHRAWVRRQHGQPVATRSGSGLGHLCDDLLALFGGDWEEHTLATNATFLKIIQADLGHKPIDAITAEDLKKFVNALPRRTFKTPKGKTKTGGSRSQIKGVITQLRKVFDLAAERGLIMKNPARSITVKLKMPAAARRVNKSIFPPNDLPAFLAALRPRDRIIVWISILGGTRPNELFALRGRDVGPNWLNVEKALDRKRKEKETKTRRSRFVYLPQFVAAELKKWMLVEKTAPGDLVFPNQAGRPIERGNFLKRNLRGAAKRAKIAALDVDFRMLRRSFSTLAQVVGMDVKAIQAQLGHAKPDMSAGEYMQPIDPIRAQQLEQLGGMINGTIPMPVDVMAKLGTQVVN